MTGTEGAHLHRLPVTSFAGQRMKQYGHSKSAPSVSGGLGSIASWPSKSLAVLADGAIETASSWPGDAGMYLVAVVSV